MSSFDDEESAAGIDLDAGEIVTCTFTNTKRGTIKIVNDAVPDTDQSFSFSETIPNGESDTFSLDGGDTDTAIFADVPAGEYTVTENGPLPTGWDLTGLELRRRRFDR